MPTSHSPAPAPDLAWPHCSIAGVNHITSTAPGGGFSLPTIVSLPDSKGETHEYRVRIAEGVPAAFALWFERLDGEGTYLVQDKGYGGWACQCEHFRFRKSCKHLTLAQEIRMGQEAQKQPKPEETTVTEHSNHSPPASASPDFRAIQAALAAFFPPQHLKWKPQAVSKDKTKALAVAYIDARIVMNRLDEVVGCWNWQDAYHHTPDGGVVCTLSVCFGGQWISKSDTGGESKQPGEDDKRKSAFSDALKRAAIKFGIGRYLYFLPSNWVAYDDQKRRFTGTHSVPNWAIPKTTTGPLLAVPDDEPEGAEESPYVNDEELIWLQKLVKAANVDLAWFLEKSGNLPNLQSMPHEQYERALAFLNGKIDKQRATANGPS